MPSGTLCLTFDNMGSAEAIGRGACSGRGAADEGPSGYPKVLDLLDELGLRATFFVEGWNAEHNAHAICELASRGHEIGLHGWVHETFHNLSRSHAERVLTNSIDAFSKLGLRPQGFRAPGGKRGPHTADLLKEYGLTYDSSVDEIYVSSSEIRQPSEVRELENGLINVPWRWEMIDYFQYVMHPDGPRTPRQLEQVFCDAVECAAEEGTLLTLIFHPWVSGNDHDRVAALRRVLLAAKENKCIEIWTAHQVASQLQESNG